MNANVTAVIRSSRDIGPMLASSARADAGASGVLPTRGGKSFETSRGNKTIATSAGTHDARIQGANPILSPNFSAICTPIGLAEVAVNQSADETARLAMAQNIK